MRTRIGLTSSEKSCFSHCVEREISEDFDAGDARSRSHFSEESYMDIERMDTGNPSTWIDRDQMG